MNSVQELQAQVAAIARGAGVEAHWHVRDLDGDTHVGGRADERVVLASVFKVLVLLELARQAAAGELELTDRIWAPAGNRCDGPTGLSVMLDDVDISLRDAALLMMSVSDNEATDLLLKRVGLERVRGTLRALGLHETRVVGDCRHLLDQLAQDIGAPRAAELGAYLDALPQEEWPAAVERAAASAAVDPQRATSSTPEELTRLMAMIWHDEAGPATACAEVRRVLGLQAWAHRTRAGFDDQVKVSGKTGTLPFVRNELSVVELPDGGRYAVAVFLRSASERQGDPKADAAISEIARVAVEHVAERGRVTSRG